MITTIFDAVNGEFDQIEHKCQMKLQQKLRQLSQTMTGSMTTESNDNDASGALSTAGVASSSDKQTTKDNRTSLDEDDILSWPADLLLEWWMAPEIYGCGPSDCIIESEMLRLGGPFLHTWQRKHVRLFPNRLEIYAKSQHGIPLKGAEVSS